MFLLANNLFQIMQPYIELLALMLCILEVPFSDFWSENGNPD